MQRQKRHAVTNAVKDNFLICGFVRCMKSMIYLANTLFFLFDLAYVQWNSQKSLTLINFYLVF